MANLRVFREYVNSLIVAWQDDFNSREVPLDELIARWEDFHSSVKLALERLIDSANDASDAIREFIDAAANQIEEAGGEDE